MDKNRFIYDTWHDAFMKADNAKEREVCIQEIKSIVMQRYVSLAKYSFFNCEEMASEERKNAYNLFSKVLRDCPSGDNAVQLACFIIYNTGKINGIRQERARRKRKVSNEFWDYP